MFTLFENIFVYFKFILSHLCVYEIDIGIIHTVRKVAFMVDGTSSVRVCIL